jgi:hypothetical protein
VDFMHCTCLFVETREQIACQDWIKVAGTHGDCTDVVEMAQQEAEVCPMLAIDPTCPHGIHYFPDARGLCKMILVDANITVEVPGQSALEQLKTLRVPILYGLLAKERRVGERVAAIMRKQCGSGLFALTRGGDSDDSTTTSSRTIGSHRVLISVATMSSRSASDWGLSGRICPCCTLRMATWLTCSLFDPSHRAS